MDEEDIISNDSSDDFFGNLEKLLEIFVEDENVHKLTTGERHTVYWDSLLGAIQSKPDYDKNIKPRYEFIRFFRYNYKVNRASLKGDMRNALLEVGSNIMAFRGLLAEMKTRNPSSFEQGGLINFLKGK